MSRKGLSVLISLVMMLSVCLAPTQAIGAAAYLADGGGEKSAAAGERNLNTDRSQEASDWDTEEPDTENPYGAEKLEEVDRASIFEKKLAEAAKVADYGKLAYEHLYYLSETIGTRVADSVYGAGIPEDDPELAARNYIADEFAEMGYVVNSQPFTFTSRGKRYESANIIAEKKGAASELVIVGAHYDSVTPESVTVSEAVYMYGEGADDNASGVAIMLEAAERLADLETPYSIRFVAFGAEEKGLKGSKYYVSQMSEEEVSNTVAMINLDSCIAGDDMNVYGDAGEKGWVREKAINIAERLGLDLGTQQGLNPDYPAGTTGLWSDHAPFVNAGIPYAYFEATNWTLGAMDGYTQVDYSYGINGEIWHTGYDNIEYIEDTFPGRINERLSTFSQVLTNLLVQMEKPGQGVIGISLSEYRLSLSEEKEIEVTADLGYMPEASALEWTLGGKAFSEWKKYDSNEGGYFGDPYITLSEEPSLDGSVLKAKIRFGLPYGTVNLSRSARRLYPALIGNYELALRDSSTGKSVSTVIKYNAYDSYHTYDEIKPAIDEITENAKPGRYLEYKSLGKTVDGRDGHFVILAEDREAVDQYLNETMPLMLEDPQVLQDRIEDGTMGDYKLPVWFNNIHPDEAPGIDAILQLFEDFATKDTIEFLTTGSDKIEKTAYSDGTNVEDPGEERTQTITVDEALKNVIFLFNFTENPDGRYYNTRSNVNGFDINRDNVYQTQVEARLTTSEIVKWKPLSFLDFHGFMPGFCIEPCTTPHDPNFEYDLLIENMVEQAHLMGKAGIANTKYTNYEIPYEDYIGGWDDAVPSYTAVYAMMLGALGHTIEIPELNEDSVDALVAAGLASVKYVSENKDRLYENQLECYQRGIEGIDAKDEVDPWLQNAAGEVIGRPRGDNVSFFPGYYVIPVSGSLQKNALEAYKLAEYMLRNGIRLEKTTAAVKAGETTYPEGSFVIDMHQALRGYANEILYDGYDVSDFPMMYAEIVNAFHDTRGFDRYEVREAGIFDGKTEAVRELVIPRTEISGKAKHYIIQNSNNDAVRAVNELLDEGKRVELLLEAGKGYSKGDYLVSREDLTMITDEYLLDVSAYYGNAQKVALEKPMVAAVSATGHLAYALEELGFELTGDTEAGNIIVTDSSADVGAEIEEGMPYVGIGGSAMRFVRDILGVEGFDYISSGYEALMRGKIAQDSFITSGYTENSVIYNAKGGYISSVPDGAKVLVRLNDDATWFKAGWWPDTDVYGETDYGKLQAKGKALSVEMEAGPAEARLTIFANNLVNKAHPQIDWRMLANAIFTSLVDTTVKPVDNDDDGAGGSSRKHGRSSGVAPRAADINMVTVPYEALAAGNVAAHRMTEYKTASGALLLPDNMLTGTGLAQAGDSIGISLRTIAVGSLPEELRKQLAGRTIFDVSLQVNGAAKAWSNPDAPVTIAVKYMPTGSELKNPDNIVIWYLDEINNVLVPVPNCRYDASTGMVRFIITHFSKYAIAYSNRALTDIGTCSWAEKEINSIVAKGIMRTSSAAGFGPGEKVNRAEFVYGLIRALGLSASFKDNFSDVDAVEYYYYELGTAKALGIAQGLGDNRFMPEDSISRQDMMVLTARALKAAGRLNASTAKDMAGYVDFDDIADYAKDSVKVVIAEGIITGAGNRINPMGLTTRAETAVILYRLVNN
ncbi:MAG TPA: M20/M25/M40 family metallo-hydrolase [Negativicutes bacterium]|nr:M20/M25/M40 family metallo-hydrolase [Negativicutes bacterium]